MLTTYFIRLRTVFFSPSLHVPSNQVEDLKAKLAVQEVELWQRNADIEALIAKIGQQTDKVNQERAVADAEEQKVSELVFLCVEDLFVNSKVEVLEFNFISLYTILPKKLRENLVLTVPFS